MNGGPEDGVPEDGVSADDFLVTNGDGSSVN